MNRNWQRQEPTFGSGDGASDASASSVDHRQPSPEPQPEPGPVSDSDAAADSGASGGSEVRRAAGPASGQDPGTALDDAGRNAAAAAPGGGDGQGTDKQHPGKHGTSLTVLSLKLGIAALCVCAVFFLYFSSVVYSEYDNVNDKWVLPAVVYSRALELYPDQRLSIEQMIYELKLLKYRLSDNPRHSGEYGVNYKSGRIVVIRRPFVFPDAREDRLSFMIEFSGRRVSRILNADTMQELSYVRMDPVLLDRINRIDPREDRIFIELAEVPQMLITTLLEIEDRAFFEHLGVNFLAIARAFVKNVSAGRVVEGGSTITQQLVKNYFLNSQKSYARKFKEIIMALIMDHRYSKEQILEAYLNEIYLGQNGSAGIYGFGLASYFYFGIPISELSVDQMALLVGLIKGPSYYDPWRQEAHALERRNTVLAVLRSRGHLSEEEYRKYSERPIGVIRRGSMNYSKTPAFMGLLKMEISERFGEEFLSGNGIRIFSSLDPQSQAAAEQAVAQELDAIEERTRRKGLEAAMVVSSWRTAEVAAVVGSRTPQYAGFNRVIEGRRQIGSLAKPFVYHTAFSRGYHLGNIVIDEPITVRLSNGKLWSPKNDDKNFRGEIRVINAMARSLNVPTVKIGMHVGLRQVVDTFRAAGLQRELPLYPSILLGSMELTPYELNALYAGLATEGVYTSLTTLRTVVKDGQVVYERGNTRREKSLDARDVYLTLYGMTEATRTGTARRIGRMFPEVRIASKTGTTNDNRDTWAVGLDSEELVTTWVGYDDNKSTNLYGSSGALMVYGAYLKERGVNSLELKRPEGIKFVNFNAHGQIMADGCSLSGLTLLPVREDFIQDVVPCSPGGGYGAPAMLSGTSATPDRLPVMPQASGTAAVQELPRHGSTSRGGSAAPAESEVDEIERALLNSM